jgi:hypothetical protein
MEVTWHSVAISLEVVCSGGDALGVEGIRTLDGKAVLDPVLLAADVYRDVRVADRFEAAGNGLCAAARAAAVDDHRRIPVRDELLSQAIDLGWRNVDSTGKVRVAVEGGAQRLHEYRPGTASEQALEVFPSDAGGQQVLLSR